MKCFTQNRLHWINTSNSDNMEFKFKEPHKETRESMAKVASGENPYLNDRNNSFEKNCQKKVKEITGHEYCEITSSGNNSIFIALSAIEGSVIIPDQGGWNGFKQIANYLNKEIITLKTYLQVLQDIVQTRIQKAFQNTVKTMESQQLKMLLQELEMKNRSWEMEIYQTS